MCSIRLDVVSLEIASTEFSQKVINAVSLSYSCLSCWLKFHVVAGDNKTILIDCLMQCFSVTFHVG